MHIFCKFSLPPGEIQIEENVIENLSSEFEESDKWSTTCEIGDAFLGE